MKIAFNPWDLNFNGIEAEQILPEAEMWPMIVVRFVIMDDDKRAI